MSSMPDIDDPKFNQKITRKFSRFTIPKQRNNIEKICFPKEYKIQIPQLFLAEYINPRTPYKGILVYHRIGAGKSCAAIRISEHFVKAKYQILIVLPASLRGNFRDELRSKCAGEKYITNAQRIKLTEMLPSNKEYIDIIKESNDKIDLDYKIYSYNKFFEIIDTIELENTLLIIDEVQNVVSETGNYYKLLSEKLRNPPDTLRIVVMTATPIFDKPIEIALTMNLILPEDKQFSIGSEFNDMYLNNETQQAINLDDFKERIKGYVSYFRGAPEIAFPKALFHIVKCPMSKFQYKIYNKVRESEPSVVNEEGLSNSFFIGSRICSNYVFRNGKPGDDGLKNLKDSDFEMDVLNEISIKLWKLMKKIKNNSGLHFVYSAFKGYAGLTIIAKMLEHYGYKNYHTHGPGPKRYAFWTGDQTDNEKAAIKALYNHAMNVNGSQIKIILGSPSIKEGVSLLRVHVIHIFEPYWNMSRLEQVIGRGIRYCSHKDMPEDKRYVLIYLYLATYPNDPETIDQKIFDLAQEKLHIRSQFETAIKEAAVDCKLFYEANKNEGILCMN